MNAAFNPTPGVHLYNALMAGFRANGTTLGAWLEGQTATQTEARNAAFGQNSSPKARALLAQMIEAAGPEIVRVVYESAVRGEAQRLAS